MGPIDGIVVHLGILERMSEGDHDRLGWRRALKNIREWAQADPQCEIFICSGRGVPKEVRESRCRFIPISAVERWAIHSASKYHLYDLLASSRSIEENG